MPPLTGEVQPARLKSAVKIIRRNDRSTVISRLALAPWNLAARYPRITGRGHNRPSERRLCNYGRAAGVMYI